MTIASSLAGAAWVSANAIGYWRYRTALDDPARAQSEILAGYLKRNAETAFGRLHGFASLHSVDEYRRSVPLASYADFVHSIEAIARGEEGVLTRSPVRTLGLSSGSVAAAKKIPFTAELQREFRCAIAPWVVDLSRSHPAIVGGCAYWSITPFAAEPEVDAGAVRVGFDEDSEYLGAAWRRLANATLAVPGAVRLVRDIEAFRYLTLLFLLRRPDLTLVSVWHPSFLTLLLRALPTHWRSLVEDVRKGTLTAPGNLPEALGDRLRSRLRPLPRRATQLSGIGPRDCVRIWPRLRLVSCWADGHARLAIDELKALLPGVTIQPKGLLATEAVVTLPFRGLTPVAVRSHFFEFLQGDCAYLAHELARGEAYSVVVTTGGGLYRYRLEDRVEVNGFVGRTPSLKFLGKEDHVSDLCGEKLNESFVAATLDHAFRSLDIVPGFALLAPDLSATPPGYTLYVELDQHAARGLGDRLERLLVANPHYQYSRKLGQLSAVRIFLGSEPMFPEYLRRCCDAGQRAGDVKPLSLSPRAGWSDAFAGQYEEGTGVPALPRD
ncbi:MAG TPA: GH3 auxin-responsive promoter family protein [Vicinamibacterales bacterium]|nr:GH3 auxin-responsive promoter family protein [Vicinamibacterales bacterium]